MIKLSAKLAILPVVAGALVFASVNLSAAHADDAHPTPEATTQSDDGGLPPMPRPSGAPGDSDDLTHHHKELHAKYGDDVDQVFLPPLVVKGSSTQQTIGSSSTGSSTGNVNPTTLKDATQVDPTANMPINPSNVQVSSKTPADVFFQQATFGLGLMAVGAISLGSIALLQRRRNRGDAANTYNA